MSEVRAATTQVSTVSAGAVVDRTLRLIDLDATFAALAGATAPEDLLGRAIGELFPTLEGPLLEVLASGTILPAVQAHACGDGLAPLRLAPLLSSRGTIVGVELTFSNVGPSAEPEQGAVARALSYATDWRKVATELQVSKARLRATFDHAPLGIAHVTLDGHLMRVNKRLCSITGYGREQLRTLNFQALTHPDDPALDLAQVVDRLASEDDTYEIEQRYLRADGSTVWISLTVSLIRTTDGAPDYFIAMVEVIDRRKAAEAELRFQAQLLDAVGQGVIATDVDGTVRYWNSFAEQLYGWTRAEALGRNVLDLTTADLAREQGEAIMAQLQAGERWTGRYTVRRRDGVSFPIYVTNVPLYNAHGAISGIVGVSADISVPLQLEAEREQLLEREQAAREQADEALALLNTLLDTAPIGFCFLSPDYRYLRINEALATMNGLPADQHLGRSVRTILPDLAPMLEPIFAEVFATGVPLIDLEIVEEHAPTTGGRRIWRASYYPVCLPDGRIAGLGIIANDITTYREASEALRLSAERFRVALKNSPILVYTTDHELRYTWIYNAHPNYDAEQVLGLRDEDLLPAAEAAKLTAVKQRVLEQARGARHEVQLVVAGETLVYDMTIEPLYNANGAISGLTVASIDITLNRRAEAALRESEARYSALAEAVPAILFTNQPDGSNDYLSQNYYDFTGTERGSGEGYAWLDQLHPADRERIRLAWQTAVQAGTPLDLEFRFRRYDGVYRWFQVKVRPLRDLTGAITRWFGVCLDVEDQKRASAEREELLALELAARAAAERTATRIAQLQEVTAALSEARTPAQVAEVVVNRSLAALGAAAGSLRLISADGQSLDVLSHVKLPDAIAEPWKSIPLDASVPVCFVARTGQPLYFANRAMLAADYPQMAALVAPLGYAAFAIVPLVIEGHSLGSLALTFVEPQRFTDEDRDLLLAMASQAAQAFERARLYAATRDAIEVRDNFIAIAAHDLRSPLTALLGQAQLLERRAEHYTPQQIHQRARVIVEQTQRINRMIGTLLDLSRIQSGQLTIEFAPLDLAALAARIVAELQPTLNRHRLELNGVLEGLLVAGDELRLEHVLYNLIGNAVKYSPKGGVVTVHVAPQGAHACITVSDEGIGIPSEALPHLFERYYRASNASTSGMGIGLYAAREVLIRHGGMITVTSREGEGSTFTISLPLTTP